MKTTVKKLESSEAELLIALSKEEMTKYDDATVEHLAEVTEIPGFRRGKAPKMILLQHLGHEKYNKEFMEKAIPLAFMDAIHEQKLNTIAAPDIELVKFIPGEELEFKAKVALRPEIEIGEYKKIKVERQEIKAEEGEVDQTIKTIQRRAADMITRPATEPAIVGDRTEIDFDVFVDGKLLDRGSSKNHPLILGEGVFIPGFEERVIGMKTGEEKEFELTFPPDYHEKNLSGKFAKFKVKVNLIQKVVLPPLDSEFAKRFGAFENIDALKKNVRAGIELEKNQDEELRVQEAVVNSLAEITKVALPRVLIVEESNGLEKSLEENLSKSGIELPQYLESVKKTHEQMHAELEVEARRRITISMGLSKVAELEDISATAEEIEKEAQLIKETMPDEPEPERIAKSRLAIVKTLQFLIKNATI